MKIFFYIILAIFTIASCIVLAIPGIMTYIVFLGLLFPPLWILLFAPTITLYIFIWVICLFFKKLGKWRYALGAFALLAVGLGIPYYYNDKIYNEINLLISKEVKYTNNINKAHSLQITGSSSTRCDKNCLDLLYNEVFKEIYIGHRIHGTPIKKYSLYQANTCPKSETDTLLGFIYRDYDYSLKRKLHDGLCIQHENVNNNNVQASYTLQYNYVDTDERVKKIARVRSKRPEQIESDIKRFFAQNIEIKVPINYKTIRYNEVSLIDNTKNMTLFHNVSIIAKPLTYPLMLGPFGGGSGIELNVGWGRKDFEYNWENLNKNYYKILFGHLIDTQELSYEEKSDLLLKALLDKSDTDNPDLMLWESYIEEIRLSKRLLTDKDFEVISAALEDDRLEINYIPKEFYRNRPENIRALAKRHLDLNTNSLDNIIADLTKEETYFIKNELIEIALKATPNYQVFRSISRIADHSPNAVNIYINLLNEFLEIKNIYDYRQRSETIKATNDRAIGAIIGLCRLGKDAIPAKDMLLDYISEFNKHKKPRDQYNTRETRLAIDVLFRLGFIDELNRFYGPHKKSNRNLDQKIITLKNLSIVNNDDDFCYRHYSKR